MKYKEVFFSVVFWKPRDLPCKFRFDPVPHTKKFTSFSCIHKIPRVVQEKKWAYAHGDYVRKKRNSRNLPDAWDDYQRADIRDKKSWKKKKIQKQWMKNK